MTATDTAVAPVDGRKNNQSRAEKPKGTKQRDPNSVQVQVFKTEQQQPIAAVETTHLSLDDSKGEIAKPEAQPIASASMPEQAIQTPVNPSNVTVSNDEVAELAKASTPSAPSAEPVTAQLAVTPSQGRAKNDPREVYKAYQAQFSPVASVVSTSVTKISGTVSQFINQYLDNAAEKMATDSVVSCFIQAIDAFNHQAATTTTPAKDNVVVAEQQRFGQYFRNYGYASLSAQNLDDYHTAILPANQFQRQAGKTDAALPAVTKRAINDPRGSLVNTAVTQAPTDSNPSVAEPNSETGSVTGQVEAASTQSASPNQNHLSYQAGTVGAWIVARLGEQGHALIGQGKLVEAYLQAHNAPVANRPTEPVSVTTIADDATANQDVDLVPTADESAVAFNTDSEGVEATDVEDSAEAAAQKRKTTPVSYKNMIESVAEQMKPATVGMLTLATPKAPKTRTRKAKASEKPAAKPKTRTSKKVENAVVVTKKSTTTPQTDVAPSHDESVTPQHNQ